MAKGGGRWKQQKIKRKKNQTKNLPRLRLIHTPYYSKNTSLTQKIFGIITLKLGKSNRGDIFPRVLLNLRAQKESRDESCLGLFYGIGVQYVGGMTISPKTFRLQPNPSEPLKTHAVFGLA
jgi:hypothetical protein